MAFDTVFLGNTVSQYFWAVGVAIVVFLSLELFKGYLIIVLKRLAKKSKSKIDDMFIDCIKDIPWIFFMIFPVIAGLKTLTLNALNEKILNYILLIFVVYFAGKSFHILINHFVEFQEKKQKNDVALIRTVGLILKVILWSVILLLFLSNVGVDVTSLIAGLGVGGIAIAFALQNILGDIFASFSIYFDKPFNVGDFIIIGVDMGVVKDIGLKSTRIQTLQGQELIVSNQELTTIRINNYKKMEKRRVVFKFGLEYGTSVAKLKKAKQIVKDVIKKQKNADLDRVHFNHFGDFALLFEVVYYMAVSDYTQYMDTQESINLKIKELFEKSKISMAFPTQTIHVKK